MFVIDSPYKEWINSVRVMQRGHKIGEANNMEPNIYYIYAHILKWDWKIVEVGEMDGAIMVKIASPITDNRKLITIFRSRES
jgi:hypothetical protein